MRRYTPAVLLLAAVSAVGQNGEVAKQIYASSQDSVFLIYLNDSSGTPGALGSGFLVAPKLLITNAHVVEAGSPVLAVGPVRIPLKILRMDKKNDLAILSVDADLTSKPLQLAPGNVTPGEQVFAIGNPEGLEKTISQGIVSGLRKREGRDLLQITSPISHGSSGGPILNSQGEVVGVAVGMLEDGQNLNFAVPVDYVRAIMTAKPEESPSPTDTANNLSKLVAVNGTLSKLEYSNEPSSDYQQAFAQMGDLMEKIANSSKKDSELAEVACLGAEWVALSDKSIEAAKKLATLKPTPESRALLSYVLFRRAQLEALAVDFAEKGSDAATKATAAHDQFLSAASHEAAEAAKTGKGETLLVADFVLGSERNENGEYSEAIPLHSPVATGKPSICGTDLAELAYRNLISENYSAKRPEDTERWFRRFANLYQPGPFDWDSEGDRRVQAQDHAVAADAYERAGAGSQYLGYDFCYAAVQSYLTSPTNADGVLDDGRKCVNASVKQTEKQAASYFNAELPIVYEDMAEVLEGRGVYQSALEYIKESLSAKPDNAIALYEEATIFEDMQRNTECIAAAQAAVRASDGKYSWMLFRLGSCYFDTENWNQAETNFRLAADADKTDAAAAFNAGLSLGRQGFDGDAQRWYQEALKRNPSDELRAKILRALK